MIEKIKELIRAEWSNSYLPFVDMKENAVMMNSIVITVLEAVLDKWEVEETPGVWDDIIKNSIEEYIKRQK